MQKMKPMMGKEAKKMVDKKMNKMSMMDKKMNKVMHEFKEGTLKSGGKKKVTSRKQAIAIGMSEARKAGAKVPKKPSKKK